MGGGQEPSETDDRQRGANVESISHGSDGSSEGESEEDDFVEEAQSMLLSVINDKKNISNMQLELRNYRLGALKKDVDVLKAILPIIFAKTFSTLTTYVNVSGRAGAAAAFNHPLMSTGESEVCEGARTARVSSGFLGIRWSNELQSLLRRVAEFCESSRHDGYR